MTDWSKWVAEGAPPRAGVMLSGTDTVNPRGARGARPPMLSLELMSFAPELL